VDDARALLQRGAAELVRAVAGVDDPAAVELLVCRTAVGLTADAALPDALRGPLVAEVAAHGTAPAADALRALATTRARSSPRWRSRSAARSSTGRCSTRRRATRGCGRTAASTSASCAPTRSSGSSGWPER